TGVGKTVGRRISGVDIHTPEASSVTVFAFVVVRGSGVGGMGEPSAAGGVIAIPFEAEFDLSFQKDTLALLVFVTFDFRVGHEDTWHPGSFANHVPVLFDIRVIGIIFVKRFNVIE